MCGWRQIIKKDLLGIPRCGIIGFHPTMLPKGRGPAPIINTILEGSPDSGVTLYYISEGLNDGDIIGQKSFIVDPDDYAIDIYQKVTSAGKYLVRKYFPEIASGTAPRITQNFSEISYFPKRSMEDNYIHINSDSMDTIYQKIRAFSKPYNGAYLVEKGKRLII